MRIKKYYAPWSQYWSPKMQAKYGFESYKRRFDRNEPVVVFGCYGGGTKQDIMNHQGLVVIVWSGSDSVRLHEKPNFVHFCRKNAHRVFHIAHSHWIQVDLAHFGLNFIDKVVIPVDLSHISHEKEVGDSVYHYGTHQRYWYYGTHLIDKLEKKWSGTRGYPSIIKTTQTAYKGDELLEQYKKSFLGVRLTEHDNMSITVIEMGLMGRRSIFNGDVPAAIPYPCHPYDRYEPETRKRWVWQDESLLPWIENKIMDYRQNGVHTDPQLAEEMREFIHDDQEWLNTEFYEI